MEKNISVLNIDNFNRVQHIIKFGWHSDLKMRTWRHKLSVDDKVKQLFSQGGTGISFSKINARMYYRVQKLYSWKVNLYHNKIQKGKGKNHGNKIKNGN